MELLQLTCSNPNFKTLNFKSGFNLVVGIKISEDQHKSTNGIGKSMTLNLLHFMLGATPNLKREKKKFLENYGVFTLVFQHNNVEYCVEKNFSDSSFKLDGRKFGLKKYKEKLTEIFGFSSSPCSFRQIFDCFARRYDEDIDYYKTLQQQGQNLACFEQKLTNLFLLGIDMDLIQEYHVLHQEMKELENIKKALTKQRSSQTNQKNIDEEILALEEKITKIEIYAGYDELKEKDENLTLELNQIRNNLSKIRTLINLKRRNLKDIQTKVNLDEIERLYQEAQLFFSKNIFQTLQDVQNFHITLIENRRNRIHEELKSLEKDLDNLTKQEKEKGEERDQILKNLKNNGVLEERDSIMNAINNLKLEKQKMMRYALLIEEMSDKEKDKKQRIEAIKEQSLFYLHNTVRTHIDQLESRFLSLIYSFYNNRNANLEILPTKKAQYLFDIQINTEQGGSQGRDKVKTFCYDTLLYMQNPTLLRFMAHDGCIFSGMDVRQQAIILKIALELVDGGGFQYFLNIDSITFDNIKKIGILSQEEICKIENGIILSLDDNDPKNWLFGEKF